MLLIVKIANTTNDPLISKLLSINGNIYKTSNYQAYKVTKQK